MHAPPPPGKGYVRSPDVNVLVYAFRDDTPQHRAAHAWLEDVLNAPSPYAIADLVLLGFLRIVTHPSIFDPPSTLAKALAFADVVRSQPNCVQLCEGPGHWQRFGQLCMAAHVKGNLIPDAYLAAMALAAGADWVSEDRDFAKFPGLRWRRLEDSGA